MHKTTQHDTRCPEKKLEAIRAPQYLRHQDVVDWDVDELDEETNEPHDEKPNGGGFGHLHELCAEANGIEDRGNCQGSPLWGSTATTQGRGKTDQDDQSQGRVRIAKPTKILETARDIKRRFLSCPHRGGWVSFRDFVGFGLGYPPGQSAKATTTFDE